jgi:hypothetical protein
MKKKTRTIWRGLCGGKRLGLTWQQYQNAAKQLLFQLLTPDGIFPIP